MIWQKITGMRSTLRIAGALLLVTALIGLIGAAVPAHAAGSNPQLLQRSAAGTLTSSTIAANFYLPTSTLRPIFQSRIDQQVPIAVNSAIDTLVAKLPASSQSWADQMAKMLIQPSASLTGLTPQQDGLATTLRVSLYPGDPRPTNASMLVTFSIKGSSTIQVSAQAQKNSPSLVSGPLATFKLPVGQLTSIQTTPSCGSSALALGLQFPVSLNLGQSTATAQPAATTTQQPATITQQPATTTQQPATITQQPATTTQQPASTITQQPAATITQQPATTTQQPASATSAAYVEIPASSLAALASNVGTIPLSSSMSASNIQIAVQGNHLVVTSDILLGSLQVGQATTLITPTASNGSLAVQVTQTTLSVLIVSFQYNTYNQQIEQLINSKLSGALAGTFTVNSATIGANSQIPCAASDSLIISGTTGLIS